ncbi:DUF4129 domain-containing protein [Actinotalea solisilvae]|uniref:DUF4129 domain-containing protein n=1 Tax=Actinotalea solisilvae TaxID=2072922 RepID=UPI0018F17DC7|nr:DUF4129 domain-containing protein [Actinotalea solisilvae]
MDPRARTEPADAVAGPAAPGVGPGAAGPFGRAALAVVLVLVAVAATALTGPWDPPLSGDPVPVEQPTEVPTPQATAPSEDGLTEALEQMDVTPWDLRWLGATLAVLTVVGALYVLVRLYRMLPRRRPEDPPDDAGIEPGSAVGLADGLPDLPALRDGVRDAGDELRAHVCPADAVIAAWVALEAAADASGLHRDPAATPTEFTVEVMDRTPADPAAIRTLLALYLRARFSTDPVGPDDVASATAAVRTLARGLAAGGRPPDAPGADGGGAP